MPSSRAPRTPRRRAPAPIEIRRPHPGLWATAMRFADGEGRRITVQSETHLVVDPARRLPPS